MSLGDGPASEGGVVLRVLDQVAERVLNARALIMTLPSEQRGDLSTLTDILLTALGQRIAAELPHPAVDLNTI